MPSTTPYFHKIEVIWTIPIKYLYLVKIKVIKTWKEC